MRTKIINIDKDNIDKKIFNEAVNVIKNGGIVAFPTETVYGLGANGLDKDAVAKIFEVKGRPADNPLILHIYDIAQMDLLTEEIPPLAFECMKRFWPGPLTMILKKSDFVPDITSGGLDTVAIRMPDNPIALELIKRSNTAIAAPSANISGKPSPTSADHVRADLSGKIDLIIDGNKTGVGLESTVLDLSTDTPTILRPGGVSLEDLASFIPNLQMDDGIKKDFDIVKSPGQKYSHYAPSQEMRLFVGELDKIVEKIKEVSQELLANNQKVGIIATEETKDQYEYGLVLELGSRNKKDDIARNLFNIIRIMDETDVDIILAEGIEEDDIGLAIMNRLTKASGGRIINV